MIVLLVVGVLCVAAFVALFVWMRRSERDIDYAELRDKSTQTDEQRRLEQLGIGLTSGPTISGPQ
jgi:flagellar biosynthesis/type III secretory pathway M-ring protein FliF/YscJ